MRLNPRQREAVQYLDGPLLVVAGAGSGKTRVITEKIVHLLHAGVLPEHIAAVTFTNKAAREMRNRAGKLLGPQGTQGFRVSTFHALGLAILRAERERFSLRAGFTIFDPLDAASRVSELLLAEGARAREHAPLVQQQLSRWKSQLLTPADAAKLESDGPVSADAARVFAEYDQALRVCNAVDLDDLIYLPVKLFASTPDVLDAWRDRIRYLLVDEYQDTNAMQYELVRQLVGGRGGLTAVGDDDQSIYSWRGAVPENLTRLREDFSDLRVVMLEQNYRSRGAILKSANLLIANNPHTFEKSLWSRLAHGDPPRVMVADSEADEAQRVVHDINYTRLMHRRRWRDYAILYRGNHQARGFERSLRELNIPYHVSGGTSFFALSEIRDVMAYLRLLVNPQDDNAFLRIANTPRRGLGTGTMRRLGAFAAEHRLPLLAASLEAELVASLSTRAARALGEYSAWLGGKAAQVENVAPRDLVEALLEEIGYRAWLDTNASEPGQADRRWRNVGDLVDWIAELAKRASHLGLADIITNLALVDLLDDKENDAESDVVHLMTLHAAKGLEFPHVYLVGMEEELLPHRQSLDDEALQEERRLAYVGVTRAQHSLCMTLARTRTRYGEVRKIEPSRFLGEMEAADLRWDGATQNPEESREHGRSVLAQLRSMLGRPEDPSP